MLVKSCGGCYLPSLSAGQCKVRKGWFYLTEIRSYITPYRIDQSDFVKFQPRLSQACIIISPQGTKGSHVPAYM